MISQKHTLCIVSLIFLVVSTAESRSVYVINDTIDSNLGAYKIEDTNLVWQTNYICKTETSADAGAVGLAIDESQYGHFLFVTFEGSGVMPSPYIEVINAKTMEYVDSLNAAGATNLAGIVADQNKSKVYTMDRYTNHLYSYSWDRSTKTLTPDFNDPYYIELQGMEYVPPKGAFGIALDEEDNLLYVSDNTDAIKYYDTNDWSKKGEVNDVSCNVISIAIDVGNQLLYYGSMGSYGEGDPNLYQYDISAETEKSVTVGCSVGGIGVDQQTGLIYLTTYGGSTGYYYPNPPEDRLMVYDSNLNQLWVSDDIGNPAGVAVGSTAAYKPPFALVWLVKDSNDVNCVYPLISEEEHELLGTPYNWLYYNIEYDANGHADTNVKITDYLPVEVDYNSSDPCGLYDPNWHTVTWNIPIMSASDTNTFRIQVGVNYYAKPGHKIYNYCEIESDEYCTFRTFPIDICCYGGSIIYVNQDANGYNNGTCWQDAYTDLQDALHTARECGCNQICVAEGTYKPIDTYISNESACSISFDLVDDVAVYGGFPNSGDPNFADRNWQTHITTLSGDIRKPDDQSDNSYHVVHCNDVNNATLDGFTITAGDAKGPGDDGYGGGIYCKDSTSLTLTDCNVSDNTAYYGGALYDYNSSDVNITNCIFIGNTVNYNGGGMYNDQSSPTLINCTFASNKSTSEYTNGGGMYNDQSSPTLINCTFSGNSVPKNGGGGAIFNTNFSVPNISNCVFSGNLVGTFGKGGAISNTNSSDPNISNCTFSGNSVGASGKGGAISNTNSSDPNISNCIFSGNSIGTSGKGGAVYNNYSDPNITNCIFTGNIVDYSGGGMHNQNYSSVAIANCIFNGNRANDYGGGMANSDNSNLTLTNCTVSGNYAFYGGGICSWNYADTNLTNCIFWGNDASVSGDEIYNEATSDINVTFCDVNGGWTGTGNGNIDEDPCFFIVSTPTGSWMEDASYDSSTFQSTLTDANANWAANELAGKFVNPHMPPYQYLQFFIVSNDVNTIKVWSDVTSIAQEGDTYQIYDYHLTADSACIDRGDPNGNYTGWTDIDGERRVVDGDGDPNGTEIVDMGADEYYWSPADFNSDGIVNFFDYALFANVWQKTSLDVNDYNDIYDLVDNNCIDYNDLARFCEDWLWQTAWAKAFPFSYGQGMGKSMGMGESLVLTEEILPSASAKKPQPQLTEADIEKLLKWLVELWLTEDELRKMMSEDDWLKFIESVIQAIKEQM